MPPSYRVGIYTKLLKTAEALALLFLFVLRRFFLDLQEIPHQVGVAPPRRLPRHFNPLRLFQTPASLRRLIGSDPRVIDEAWWWKLLHAAIELPQADLPPTSGGGLRYPLALVRAVAVTWCFSALRSDEIRHGIRLSRYHQTRASPC
jgi:hypothetical protein